ncbi:mediator of RNA polymerase II transcription subunit 33A-like protein, putative [Medicago truncatula]|uniref:Mediator of RNA polymerase II transcription subunit 33A-like protein, putative n=1 Tax=Medicago truncatula TaxID=3880 RepID=G7IKF1_MEDTR|nr:mediator of RNA polymerase II transcription subunit 33A-like protein, putative [Medicago truncatula]
MRLRYFWYRQHQACIALTLSGLVHGTHFHQIVDGLLNMMFRKINGFYFTSRIDFNLNLK